MGNIISEAELMELSADGAKITFEEEESGPVEIDGFKELIAQISRVAKSNEVIAAKQSEQITMVLEKLVTACGQQKINFNPIINMVRELKELAKPKEVERPSYEFNIQRDNRGLMTSVEAIPTRLN